MKRKTEEGWTACNSGHNWASYTETHVVKPDEIFVNVCSETGAKHIREISAFVDDESCDETENWGSILKHGWRIPLRDYEDIMQTVYDEKHFIPWPDLVQTSGRCKRRIQNLINCGSLSGVERDGPALLSYKSIETLVEEIEAVVKPGNVKKAKAGAEARWGNKKKD